MIVRINSDSLQELVAAEADQKNWKGITIAILMILLILCGVGVAVLILTPPPKDDSSRGRPFEIEDILDPKFVPRTFNGSWISGKCHQIIYHGLDCAKCLDNAFSTRQ